MTGSTGPVQLGLGFGFEVAVRLGLGLRLRLGLPAGKGTGKQSHFARTTARTFGKRERRGCGCGVGGGATGSELVESFFKLLVLLLQGVDFAKEVTKVLIHGSHVVFDDIAAFQNGRATEAHKRTVDDGVWAVSGVGLEFGQGEFTATLVLALHFAVRTDLGVRALNRAGQHFFAVSALPLQKPAFRVVVADLGTGVAVDAFPVTTVKRTLDLARFNDPDHEGTDRQQGHGLRAYRALIDERREAVLAQIVATTG